jgi:hypothetical protein
MEQRNRGRQLIKMLALPVILAVVSMLMEGCLGEKRCGCGTDLNTVYKTRRHR